MTQARSQQISLQDTLYYHCVSRCVRRAFLCGKDFYSGQCYEHRRDWIEKRLAQLADIYCIDICAYAIMSNHYHVVLHVDRGAANALTDDEVIERWQKLFKGPLLVRRYQKGLLETQAEKETVADIVNVWRNRLMDISWFMRCINEHIARQANKEDQCKGRFWEGRFKSQALLDEAAILACMAYVDLNPVRAKMAETPEGSDFTSIQQRIFEYAAGLKAKASKCAKQQSNNLKLMPFIGNENRAKPKGITFSFADYLSLVEHTGRVVRKNKRDVIPATAQPILNRLGLDEAEWIEFVVGIESRYGRRVSVSKVVALRKTG